MSHLPMAGKLLKNVTFIFPLLNLNYSNTFQLVMSHFAQWYQLYGEKETVYMYILHLWETLIVILRRLF